MEMGTNRYAVDEHDQFREVIVKQLAAQTAETGATATRAEVSAVLHRYVEPVIDRATN